MAYCIGCGQGINPWEDSMEVIDRHGKKNPKARIHPGCGDLVYD